MSVACPYAGLMFIKHGISDNRHKTNGGEFFGLKNTQSYFVIRSTSNKASQFTICCSNFEKKKIKIPSKLYLYIILQYYLCCLTRRSNEYELKNQLCPYHLSANVLTISLSLTFLTKRHQVQVLTTQKDV